MAIPSELLEIVAGCATDKFCVCACETAGAVAQLLGSVFQLLLIIYGVQALINRY